MTLYDTTLYNSFDPLTLIETYDIYNTHGIHDASQQLTSVYNYNISSHDLKSCE